MNLFPTLFCFLCVCIGQICSQTKGVNPVDDSDQPIGTVYAVIVGVSSYQDENIPDLRFAHKDAISFSNYLQSSSGGSLDGDHLKLLFDSTATLGGFVGALDWLKSVAKADDRVIIYFSGHGDLEYLSKNEMGFLLCFDASSHVYNAGGAMPLFALQEAIASLSTINQSKVILITDACHSGTLAGSSIGGPHITAEYLKALDNEVKILSCQPKEFSIEGEQWGGGRGVFSYHLVDGLNGLADQNNDSWVSLQELGWYLENHVSLDVAPVKQVPLIVGERLTKLAAVNPIMLDSLLKGKFKQDITLTKIESRSEALILSSLDTNIQHWFKMFNYCLKNKIFLTPISNSDSVCAEFYFQKLIKQTVLKPLFGSMRRNYATALQDDAQQVLNALLKVDVHEIGRSKIAKSLQYKNYPAYLNRAAQLLGSDNFFYKKLRARIFWFEGIDLLWANSGNKNVEAGLLIMQKFRQSLDLEANAALSFFYMMNCQAIQFEDKDSMRIYGEKAALLAPNWLLPYAYLSHFYAQKFHDTLLSKIYLDKLKQMDSLNSMVIFAEASWHYYTGNTNKADSLYQLISSKDPENKMAFLNLGIVNIKLKRYTEATTYLKHYIQLDTLGYQGYHYLAIAHEKLGDENLAENNFLKSISLDSNYVYSLRELARLYRKQKRNIEVEKLYRKILTFEYDKKAIIYYEMACLSSLNNRIPESLDFLKQALDSGFKNIEQLFFNQELNNVSKDPEYRKLIEKFKK